ncbi:uncharacterized protein BCR38DRAFT_519788 [Pseudomassariella vexata]|uniref:Rhodopsin domain-containing protein n=1 Tax=Pseudomassariella vexata TaxID=1141098 RepID=A0A1Y2EIV5_9PEZI|nr:uncharacterized protein BCR38DRAFT_519788 [Pseudomassariella vexata]ORY71377.1 hypothetical protein BCR38DRAFT_519788 [Pseudomassariella vexata]
MFVPDNDVSLLVSSILLTSISTIVVFTRLYTRVLVIKNPGADDWLMAIAVCASMSFMVVAIYLVRYGLGASFGSIPPENLEKFFHGYWATVPLYNLGLICCKLSIVCQYRRGVSRLTEASACVTSVIRLISLIPASVPNNEVDTSLSGVDAAMWSGIEVNAAITCASLPTLKPMFDRLFQTSSISHNNAECRTSGTDEQSQSRNCSVFHIGRHFVCTKIMEWKNAHSNLKRITSHPEVGLTNCLGVDDLEVASRQEQAHETV